MAREDAAIAALERVIEMQSAQIEKLTDQIVRLSTPAAMPLPAVGGQLWLSEEQEDEKAMSAFMQEDTTVDYNDPQIKEILAAAGALSPEVHIAD